jgi:glutathione synthase/RimK-type ligase-like ATP-grasp enzyme
MKVAIENKFNKGYFNHRWIEWLDNNNIDYILVDFSDSEIINTLSDVDIVLWHFSHAAHPDFYLGKVLLTALQYNKAVFPAPSDFWYFDDKVAQKYIFENLNIPTPKTNVFYSFSDAIGFVKNSSYPVVAKLKGGAGSSNVKILTSKLQAVRYIIRSFTMGHRAINRLSNLKFGLHKLLKRKSSVKEFFFTFIKIFVKSSFERYSGNHKGYVLFQKYLPNNLFDQRVIVIDKKAFAIKRYVNDGDFRASGAGNIAYDRTDIDPRCISIAFETAQKLSSRCLALDFLYDAKDELAIAEISYGFNPEAYDPCQGYWTSDLLWHDETVEPQKWIIESMTNAVVKKSEEKT